MRLGLTIGYSGSNLEIDMDLIKEAEALGYDSIWSAEAWGSDAVSPLAWIGAQTTRIKLGTGIMQIPARTPANTAMTAMTMDALSGGRFLLGLGTSGPQVVEGWHGQAFDKPLTWMREYITIIRKRRSSSRERATRSPTAAPAQRAWASRSRAFFMATPTSPSTRVRWLRWGSSLPASSPMASF
jgi:alkanesulfonate monooxygenase SsuD/methylene tetrahydromethanopterin reductase-like flavin-dependent oxidoreductase (luciferase family)